MSQRQKQRQRRHPKPTVGAMVVDTVQQRLYDLQDSAPPPLPTLGELMVEAEEWVVRLNDPEAWGGEIPRCRSNPFRGRHNWTGQLDARVSWSINGKMFVANYPVAVRCLGCDWVIGLHNEPVDPLETFAQRGQGMAVRRG